MRILDALPLLAVLAACSPAPTEPVDFAADCLAAVQIGGRLFYLTSPLPEAAEATTPAGMVRRDLGCRDVGLEPAEPWENWDSNFLPAGTLVYSVDGAAGADRFAVRIEEAWWLLSPDFPVDDDTGRGYGLD